MPFSGFGLRSDLLRGLRDLGFTSPTPIQRDAIPPAALGRDVLATAETGSGKTAAFVLPILHRLADKPRGTTRALILTPTRELAAQIDEHLNRLARHTSFSAAAIFGGVGMKPQEQAFRKGVDVLVATPGRLLDHFRFGYAKLEGVEVVVLDEADRMLDMGFLPDVRRILRHLPAQRQTLLFSATMPPAIVTLAREMLRDPATISVGRKAVPVAGITQAAYAVPAELKSALLVELLKRGDLRSVLAFTRTKHRANRLAEYLVRNGIAAGRIHGNRSQSQRTEALGSFKAGRFPVLVATDIAARGIDVDALSHVVNFDVPGSPDDYVHRVGRTARAGARGDAFLFVSPDEESRLRDIERTIGRRLPRVVVSGFDYAKRAPEKLEVPLARRLAEMRKRAAAGRERRRAESSRPASAVRLPSGRPGRLRRRSLRRAS
jgi:ATP-dependent RNA helicase RhlE